ncbi:MAG TPA: DUF3570 domain-containing protein [Polyangiaceae bacterium]|jgi:hypothetical protein|nr:DUF3570 domain-containing protein [Polyangiaceae bacterium]
MLTICALLVLASTAIGRADGPPPASPALRDADILGPPSDAFRVQSVTTRITSFDQRGAGYQAQGGPTATAPGSERATILEPQAEVVATQGSRWTHTFRMPVDVVTAASPDAIDVMTSASRHVESGEIDWAARYKMTPTDDVTLNGGIHLENPFRSWSAGLGWSRALADGETVLSASFLEVFDWFDQFDIQGHRHGRTDRSSNTLSAGVTQIVTPTTVVNVNYGITLQRGELGNTWNSVPLADMTRGPEFLPNERLRHALVARLAQFLPWNGALHAYYRFYADDWGNVAHSVEGELLQRISRQVYVGALYRFHRQTGVSFFTPLAELTAPLRTADSDLAPMIAQTVGGKIAIDAPLRGDVRAVSFEVGYERYFRTNDLHVDVFTCATGYRF